MGPFRLSLEENMDYRHLDSVKVQFVDREEVKAGDIFWP